jgi:hypothetical protein
MSRRGKSRLLKTRSYRSPRRTWITTRPAFQSHTSPAVDLQLVDAAAGPGDLDHEVGRILVLVGTHDVALVGLRPRLTGRVLQRPGAGWREVDAGFEGVRLQQAAEEGLDAFVVAGGLISSSAPSR